MLALLVGGCATAPLLFPTAKLADGGLKLADTPAASPSSILHPPSSREIRMQWDCNYNSPNVATLVLSSTNLGSPVTNWILRLIAQTNQFSAPITNQQEFFTVSNVWLIN